MIKSPLVQVQCNWTDYDDARAGVKSAFPSGVVCPTSGLNNFSGGPYGNIFGIPVSQDLYNFSRPEDALNFTWIDLAGSTAIPQDGSLGALLTVPYNKSATTWSSNRSSLTNTSQGSLLIACTIDAHWVGAGLSFDAKASSVAATNVSEPSTFGTNLLTPGAQNDASISGQRASKWKWAVSDPIAIGLDWAAALDIPGVNPVLINRGGEQNTSMMTSLFSYYLHYGTTPLFWPFDVAIPATTFDASNKTDFGNYTSSVANEVATVLSMVLADGISRSSYTYWLVLMARAQLLFL